MYGRALDQFYALEGELLRLATYHLEAYAAQLHAAAEQQQHPHHHHHQQQRPPGAGGHGGGGGAGGVGAGGGSGGPGDPLQAVDRLAVVADMWECEAQYCAARHKALLAYYQVGRPWCGAKGRQGWRCGDSSWLG